MKKYRIITNGQSYRIQYRWLRIWRLVTGEIFCYYFVNIHYVLELDTLEEAENWIERKLNLESKLNAKWKILK